MASFSYNKHYSFLLDSSPMFLIPDTTTSMSCFSEKSIQNIYKPCLSPYQHHPFYDQADPTVEVLPSVNIVSTDSTSTTKISTCNNNSSSSAVPAQYHQVTNTMEKRKIKYQPLSKLKGKKPRKETSSNTEEGCITLRSEEKLNNKRRSRRSGDNDKKKKKNIGDETEGNVAPTGYVHVRARRGQATDSHSLAERVRREKISERMKLLQALVPGCDQVTSKALILDEIINHVQSLQNQVEFLSLKIASINPMFYDCGMNLDAFMVEPERTTSLEATNEPEVQEQDHTQATNSIFNTSGGYSLIDASTVLQHQQAQMSNIMSQAQSQSESGNGQLLWDVDEQRQKIVNYSGFTNNL